MVGWHAVMGWTRQLGVCLGALGLSVAGPTLAQPAAVATLAASAPALLPVEMFYRHPDIGQVQLSPSGRRLAVAMGLQGRLVWR